MSSMIIPSLRYRDAHAMIDWLCDVFGFRRHMIVEDGVGGVAHAQLTLGDGMFMLGSTRDDAYGRLLRDTRDGVTGSSYVVVADADAVHARAVAAGAAIVMPIQDEAHGGRGFGLRDPEGHVWYVGTYDPWTKPTG